MKAGNSLSALFVVLAFFSCSKDDAYDIEIPILPDQDIVVLYENDVHCATEGYAKFAGLRSNTRHRLHTLP